MADNFNITGAPMSAVEEAGGLDPNNPAMTYVDFANQIAKNGQAQNMQAAQVAQAQALAKQYGIRANQAGAAQAAGVNPELKDFLTVQEAVGELKAAGIDDDQIQAFVQSLGDQQMVSRQSVDSVIRKRTSPERLGQAFVATQDFVDAHGDAKDESGKPLVVGQSYQFNPDEGYYQSGGGENLIAGQNKASSAQGNLDRKDLAKLSEDLNKISQPSRGNWVSQNIGRAGRALSELAKHPDLPAQTLAFINEEIGGIFMGGVPPQSSLEASSVENAKQAINARLNYITGNPQIFRNESLKNQQAQYLIDLLHTLQQSTVDLANSMIDARVAGYPDLQTDRPQDVENLVKKNKDILNAGISPEAKAALESTKTPSATGATTPAPTAAPAANRPALSDIFGGQ